MLWLGSPGPIFSFPFISVALWSTAISDLIELLTVMGLRVMFPSLLDSRTCLVLVNDPRHQELQNTDVLSGSMSGLTSNSRAELYDISIGNIQPGVLHYFKALLVMLTIKYILHWLEHILKMVNFLLYLEQGDGVDFKGHFHPDELCV